MGITVHKIILHTMEGWNFQFSAMNTLEELFWKNKEYKMQMEENTRKGKVEHIKLL